VITVVANVNPDKVKAVESLSGHGGSFVIRSIERVMSAKE
jgi:hypothetical protein